MSRANVRRRVRGLLSATNVRVGIDLGPEPAGSPFFRMVRIQTSKRMLPSMLNPSVQVHNIDGVLVAEFWDCMRLVPAPIQDLRKHYESHVRTNGRPDVVIDLLGVGLAGSAALGHFVTLQKLIRQHGGRILFCNVDPHVHESFRVSRLVSLFIFTTDRDAALVSIRGHDGRPARGSTGEAVPVEPPPG